MHAYIMWYIDFVKFPMAELLLHEFINIFE